MVKLVLLYVISLKVAVSKNLSMMLNEDLLCVCKCVYVCISVCACILCRNKCGIFINLNPSKLSKVTDLNKLNTIKLPGHCKTQTIHTPIRSRRFFLPFQTSICCKKKKQKTLSQLSCKLKENLLIGFLFKSLLELKPNLQKTVT